ncbi:hypothetical protein E8E14_001017 [Neopestalotiopsis sp. 37M]|nr:hypothetical protein E8E14_001017 [Neopestalotiopsis sp. 37M]
MGGQAFTKGPDGLYTPRMPREVYEYVRDQCHALLRELFVAVATPIEGPGKADFGDIDIFVTSKKEDYFGPSAASDLPGADEKLPFGTIEALLGAQRKFQERDNVAMFAIPWPKLPEGIKDTVETASDKPRFIQVDVHICPTMENLEWFLFKHAHGDLWNLLGSIIRPVGLTVDEVGLYLRIPEIEKVDKKKAKVLLTTDPCLTLYFLRLRFDRDQWEKAFASKEMVFEYAATCRFFWVKPKLADADSDGNEGALDVSGDFRKENLKSNDRKRMNQRPLYRQWIEEFLPKCRKEGRFMTRPMTRFDVTVDAFEEFGVRQTYLTQLHEFRKERQRLTLWKEVIKPAIPHDLAQNFRSCAASALKKIIMEDNTTFGLWPTKALKDDNGLFLEDKVRQFVEANWEEIGHMAMEQQHTRYMESVAAKTKRMSI